MKEAHKAAISFLWYLNVGDLSIRSERCLWEDKFKPNSDWRCEFDCVDSDVRMITGGNMWPELNTDLQMLNLLAFDQLVHSRLATGGAAVRLSFVPALSYKINFKEHCIFQSSSNYSFKVLFLLVPLSRREVSLVFSGWHSVTNFPSMQHLHSQSLQKPMTCLNYTQIPKKNTND